MYENFSFFEQNRTNFQRSRVAIFFQKDPKWTSQKFKKEKALKKLLKSSFMQNFRSSTHFWHFLKKISRFFRKPLKRISKNYKFEYAISYLNYQSMFMQNVSPLASLYPDGLRHIFEENFRIFQENSLANSKKFQTWVRNFIIYLAKHRHAKFQLSSL
jgi:hypothetical protein